MTWTLLGNIISNPDISITQLFFDYQNWVYWMMFVEYTLEWALIPLSLFPWDGLVFIMGALSLQVPAIESPRMIDLDVVIMVLIIASFVGDSINYYLGRYVSDKFIDKWFSIFGHRITPITQDKIASTKRFITSYGYWSYTYGRILPIFRNFIPFVAGMVKEPWYKFIIYDMIGAIILILVLSWLGIVFGNIPWAQWKLPILMWCFFWLIIIWPMIVSYIKKLFWKKIINKKQSL